jgi:hypothetical protein
LFVGDHSASNSYHVPDGTKLGGAGVSQAHLLQPGREGRALCGLGAAAALLTRGSRGLQAPAEIDLS